MMVCPICAETKDIEALYKGFSIYRCGRCSHAFYSSPTLADEVRNTYDYKYFHGKEFYDYSAERAALTKNFRKRLCELTKLKGTGRLLEIGCAYGFFLELAAKSYDVEGIEVVEDCVRDMDEGLRARVSLADYLSMPERSESFDVVCMWDVVEHLLDPRGFVEKAYRELKPGGLITLTTGDISSLNARARGEKWRLIHPPSHAHYFTAASVKRMLLGAGFTDVSISYPGAHRSVGALIYNIFLNDMKGVHKRRRRAALEALSTALRDVSVYLNFRDIMLARAWKKG